MKLTVIGIGQTLRGDDAAGMEAVRRWRAAYPATASRKDVTVTLSELLAQHRGAELRHRVAHAQLINEHLAD